MSEWRAQIAKTARKRSIEDAMAYAVSSGIRTEILVYLHEAARSPSELAKLIKQPLNRVEYHVKEMAASGSVELTHMETVGNTTEHFYRAVKPPYFSDEELWALPAETRQLVYSLALQASTAEAHAAFRAGKMRDDPRAWVAWRWFNLDARGRNDVADELSDSWERIRAIEAAANARCIESGEEPIAMVVCTQGFQRSRKPNAPPSD